jgi:hypothetical protein
MSKFGSTLAFIFLFSLFNQHESLAGDREGSNRSRNVSRSANGDRVGLLRFRSDRKLSVTSERTKKRSSETVTKRRRSERSRIKKETEG